MERQCTQLSFQPGSCSSEQGTHCLPNLIPRLPYSQGILVPLEMLAGRGSYWQGLPPPLLPSSLYPSPHEACAVLKTQSRLTSFWSLDHWCSCSKKRNCPLQRSLFPHTAAPYVLKQYSSPNSHLSHPELLHRFHLCFKPPLPQHCTLLFLKASA